MDGSANTTIQISMNLIAFTLDYVQQILYWMGFDSCTLESLSLINDSQRRRTYNYESSRCDLYRYTVAIDFFEGAIYSYSYETIAKIVVPNESRQFNISSYDYLSGHMCSGSFLYSRLKVISHQRQKQGRLINVLQLILQGSVRLLDSDNKKVPKSLKTAMHLFMAVLVGKIIKHKTAI